MRFYKSLKRKRAMKRHPSSQPKPAGKPIVKTWIVVGTNNAASHNYELSSND